MVAEDRLDSDSAMRTAEVVHDLQPLFCIGLSEAPPGVDRYNWITPNDMKRGGRLPQCDYFQIFPTETSVNAHWVGNIPVQLQPVSLTKHRGVIFIDVQDPDGRASKMPVEDYLKQSDGSSYLLAYMKPDREIGNMQRIQYFERAERQKSKRDGELEIVRVGEGGTNVSEEDEVAQELRAERLHEANALYRRLLHERRLERGDFQTRFCGNLLTRFESAQVVNEQDKEQQKAILQFSESLSTDSRRKSKLSVVAEPGWGKTTMVAQIFKSAMEEMDPSDILIYVSGRVLALDKAEESLDEYWKSQYGDRASLALSRWYSEKDPIEKHTRLITTSYDSLPKVLEKLNSLRRHVRFMVLDEAHHLLGQRQTNTLIDTDTYPVLAMTGTEKGRLRDLQSLGFTPVYESTPLQGIERGTSPPIKIRRFVTNLQDVTADLLADGNSMMTEKKLERLIHDKVFLDTQASLFMEHSVISRGGEIERIKNTLMQVQDIEQATELYKRLRKKLSPHGLQNRVGVVHSRLSTKQITDTVTAFQEGRIDVLIGIDIIAESIDCPRLEVVFPSPTMSPIRIGQTIGRGMRGAKQELTIIEIYNHPWPEALGFQTVPMYLRLYHYSFGTRIDRNAIQRSQFTDQGAARRKVSMDSFTRGRMLRGTYEEVGELVTLEKGMLPLYEYVRNPQEFYAYYRSYKEKYPNDWRFVYSLNLLGIARPVIEQQALNWVSEGIFPEEILGGRGHGVNSAIDGYFAALYGIEASSDPELHELMKRMLPGFEQKMTNGEFPSVINMLQTLEQSVIEELLKDPTVINAVKNESPITNKLTKPSIWVRRAVSHYLHETDEGNLLRNWLESIRQAIVSSYNPTITHSAPRVLTITTLPISEYFGEEIYSRLHNQATS